MTERTFGERFPECPCIRRLANPASTILPHGASVGREPLATTVGEVASVLASPEAPLDHVS